MLTKTTPPRSTKIHRNSEKIKVCQRGRLNMELLLAIGIRRSRCCFSACTLQVHQSICIVHDSSEPLPSSEGDSPETYLMRPACVLHAVAHATNTFAYALYCSSDTVLDKSSRERSQTSAFHQLLIPGSLDNGCPIAGFDTHARVFAQDLTQASSLLHATCQPSCGTIQSNGILFPQNGATRTILNGCLIAKNIGVSCAENM